MNRQPYVGVLANLDKVLTLCRDRELESDLSTSRFLDYRRCLERLIELSRRNAAGETITAEALAPDDQPLYLTALVESTEIGDTADYLIACDPETLRPKLRDVLRGPPLPIVEDKNSNQARNMMFELSLAAKLWHVGLPPHLGEHPDLWVEIGNKKLLIECKRPFDRRTVKDQIGVARKQLIRQLAREPPGTRAVIALSLSKVINRGNDVLTYSTEAMGRLRLEYELSKRVEESKRRWQILEGTKILGLLFHVIMPALDKTANRYVVAQQMELQTWGQGGTLDHHVGNALGTALKAIAR
jgi:hypothetical protein